MPYHKGDRSPSPPGRYGVTVVGSCDHRWPGTVELQGALARDTFGGRFKLDRDDGTCPECGANAVTALFGGVDLDSAGGAPPASAHPPESHD
jgi:hypothetical protein